MFGGVVGDSALPAVPDDVEPGAGEDADCVGVVVSSGAGAGVQVGGPGVGVSAVAGEVDDSVAELFICGPPDPTCLTLPDWRVEGATPARQANDSGVGKRARQSPISVSRRAAGRCPSAAAK